MVLDTLGIIIIQLRTRASQGMSGIRASSENHGSKVSTTIDLISLRFLVNEPTSNH